MSDGNLLIFGSAVSLVAVAGAYVYLRECFTAEREPLEIEVEEDAMVREHVEVHP